MLPVEVIDEAHALLWSPPIMNRGEFDPGWNCRDHAIVFAALLRLNGVTAVPMIAHGKNLLIRGPNQGNRPVGIGQDSTHPGGHTWNLSNENTIYDYSLSLPDRNKHKEWRGLPDPVIEDGKCVNIASSDVVVSSKAFDYENNISIGTLNEGRFRATYMHLRTDYFVPEMIFDPFDWIDSPLSNKMKNKYAKSIYLKIAMHLYDFSRGETNSIAHKSQIGAWNTVSGRSDEDLATYCRLAG